MFNSNCASVPLVASIDGNGNNGNGMWGDGAWWVIILFALIFGWGNNGWGGNGNGNGGGANFIPYALGSSYTDSAIQRGFDNSAVVGKLDGITQGICDSTYSLNNSITNGFHGVDSAICNLGYQVQNGFNQTNVALMQGQNALSSQLANCCCENREAIAQVRYDMATQACDTRHAITDSTRAIVDNANANTRQLMDFLVNDKIAALQSENQSLRLAASQSNQNAVLMAAMDANKAEILRRTGAECPTPAYVVQPPQPVTFPVNSCGTFAGYNGYGNNCGCNC